MKNITYLCLTIGFFSIISCSDSSKSLSEDDIYQVNIPTIKSKTKFNNEGVSTKEIDFHIKLYEKENEDDLNEKSKAEIIIFSDNISYSFSGEYFHIPKSDYSKEKYSFITKGSNDYQSLMIDLFPGENIVIGEENSFFTNLKSKYTKSDLNKKEFKKMFQEGLNNTFFPNELESAYSYDEIPDYWMSYFGKDKELNERNEKKRIEEEKIANELLAKELKEQREIELCSLMFAYNKENYLQYFGGSSGGLSGYIPANRVRTGYVDVEGVLEDLEGKPYIGPFTKVFSGKIFMGYYVSKSKNTTRGTLKMNQEYKDELYNNGIHMNRNYTVNCN